MDCCLKSHDDQKIVGPSVLFLHTLPRHLLALKIGFTIRLLLMSELLQDHWKSQCVNVPKRKPQTSQPSHNRRPQQQRPSQLDNGVFAHSLDPSLVEQFEKFVAFQPQALEPSSCNSLSSSCIAFAK
ncbi:hypothetical protein Tco_1524085 [Tanacetum coccineum]